MASSAESGNASVLQRTHLTRGIVGTPLYMAPDLGDPRRAIGFYEEAISISREIGDINAVASTSFNTALLYGQQGEAAHAIPLAQQAERIWTQIGSPNAQKARQLLAQLQGGAPPPETVNPDEAAFQAFQRAASVQDMQAAVAAHPILKAPQFQAAIEQVIREQVPPERQPAFQERLRWLKKVAESI
jgi:tetratricopeptide (TPR) repeat protein